MVNIAVGFSQRTVVFVLFLKKIACFLKKNTHFREKLHISHIFNILIFNNLISKKIVCMKTFIFLPPHSSNKIIMRSKNTQQSPNTYESVWASFRETDRKLQETDRLQKETYQQMKENDRILTEKFAKTEKLIDQNSQRMKELQELMGGWSNSHGSFAEEYFYNSFENGKQNFFGENFDKIEKNVKPVTQKLQDEYDIVMYNHHAVAIIEVKFKVREKDITKVLKKAETFRILCPDYRDFKIYLGMASLNFCKELEAECLSQGIAIIKQVGDNVVINDTELKVF
jgi:hypothetical protein